MVMNSFIFSITICLVFQISLEIHIQLKCPEKLFWKNRAQKRCPNKTGSYHCLFDGKRKEDVERCHQPYLYGPGLRAVWNLNLDAEQCSQDKFAPNPRLSSDGYNCQFIKSKCTDIGQILVDDGTSSTDRSCRCDFTTGYAYVTSPKHPCHCKPRIEDCSCYVKFCPQNENLFSDYNCRTKGEADDNSSYCKPLETKPFQEEHTTTFTSKIHSLKNVNNLEKRNKFLTVFLSAVILAYIVTIALMSCFLLSDYCSKSHLVCLAGRTTQNCLTKNTNDPVPTTNISSREDELLKPKKEPDVICIFRQETDMVPVPNYQLTKQYHDIVDCFQKGSRHIILTGPPGAGKTQTAYQYCLQMKSKYSVVAKLVASDETTLLNSIKELLRELCGQLEQIEIKKDVDSHAKYLRDYLNHPSLKNCTYLILVDDMSSNKNLSAVIYFLQGVHNLNLLCTTYNSTFKMSYVDATHIDLRGMEKSEYLQFFKKSKYFSNKPDGTIVQIVKKIGTLPLALNCARDFIETTGETVKSYLLHFNEKKDVYSLDETVSSQNPEYKYGLLTSQTIPLNHIRTNIDKTLWEVIMLLPVLQYNSISTVVLDSCCYHLSKNIELKANEIIKKCSQFSLCQRNKSSNGKLEQCNVQSFHTATILAITWMNKNSPEGEQLENKHLSFLLKVFSFEIDTDIREESVLERNLLFMYHAIEVLEKLKTKRKSIEERFYLTFLNYAVGKTLLREGKDLSLAHRYLMKSRTLCNLLINENSEFTKHECVNGNISQSKNFKEMVDKNIHRQNMRVAFNLLKEEFMEDYMVEEFVLNKRRSETDIEALRYATDQNSLCQSYYLTKDDHNDLVDKNQAVAFADLKKTFLSELMLHILFDNGRSLHELCRISDKKMVKHARYFELSTCDEFCALLRDTDMFKTYPLLAFLDKERSLSPNKMSAKECKVNKSQRKEDNLSSHTLLGNKSQVYFEFGIAKVSLSTYEHHRCMCLNLELKNITKILNLKEDSTDNRQEIFEKGQEITEKILKKIEDNKDSDWLDTPFLYLKCAKMFEYSTDKGYLKRALKLFQQAIDMEEKTKQVIWTRNLWEAYYGSMRCLSRLNQKEEASKLYDSLKHQVKGPGCDKLLKKLGIYD